MIVDPNLSLSELISIIEKSSSGIIIYNSSLEVVFANAKAIMLCGLKENMLRYDYNKLKEDGYFCGEATKFAHKNKEIFSSEVINNFGNHLLSTASPVLDKMGNVKFIISDIRDVTDINILRNAIREKNNEILSIKEKADLLQSYNNNFIYSSEQMKKFIHSVQTISKTDLSIILEGETGVGKSFLASLIHQHSLRSTCPFITINCGAIPASLCESEFFGYEKGAFTGATGTKKGIIEAANNGTLFLDEIGELPLFMQAKLLRVLQEKKVKRVGSTKEINVNIRIVAATNKDLKSMMGKNRFREDLYHRLNGVTFTIPPLRDRPEDIQLMITTFLAQYNIKYATSKKFDEKAFQLLCNYSYPGNTRELAYIIERVVVLTPGNLIQCKDIPLPQINNSENTHRTQVQIEPLKNAVERTEKALLLEAKKKLKTTRAIGEALGISHVAVAKKLKYYGITF